MEDNVESKEESKENDGDIVVDIESAKNTPLS